MPLRLGYNTNGFAHHRLADVIDILAELHYDCVAITLDHHFLDPFDRQSIGHAKIIRDRLEGHGMSSVIETGSRFLLDPRRKHWPTLLTHNPEHRKRRLEFLKTAIDIAAVLQSEAVSFWSGAKAMEMPHDEAMALLIEGCRTIVEHAATQNVNLAFEPEPGMFIETMDGFRRLCQQIDSPRFGLTLDVGHVHCLGDGTPAERIREFADVLANIHLEDMRRGVHAHLPIGEGEMEFEPIFTALRDVAYAGPINIELSRHSHNAVEMATTTMHTLQPLL